MDTALIIITLLSIGLTGALLVYATRLQREQREREDARVLALAREINGPGPDPAMPFRREIAPLDAAPPRRFPRREILSDPDPVNATDPAASVTIAPPMAASASLFGTAEQEPAAARRVVAPLIGVAVVSLVLGGIYVLSAHPAAPAASATAPSSAAPAGTGTLELVSLDQVRTGGTLTVHGVVKNPAAAAPQRGLGAVVFVFDKSGAFVTSARAAIDYQVLAPGDESPFTVKVPNAANVARYRVSFRNDHDVLPHVDRRGR
jgi:hypothetical protein